MCIRCRNVFTESLSSNDKGIHIQIHKTNERDSRGRPLKWAHVLYIYTKLHKEWFRHSKVEGGIHVQIQTQTVRQSDKPTFIFSKIWKVG
jgi:hypothetical protein